MKAVGIIPARWASTRFPGKVLHLVSGSPLLRHVWEKAKTARMLDRVIIATDDERIADAARAWTAEAMITSPTHANGTDRVAEVAANLNDAEHIINIQGDEPLIDPQLIDRMVGELRAKPVMEMITAAHPFADSVEADSPHQVKVVIDAQSDAIYFSRSPIPFYRDRETARKFLRHQGIYGYRRDFLMRFVRWKVTPLEQAESLEQLRAIENGVKIHVLLTTAGSPGVDTLEDVAEIERLLHLARQKAASPSPR